MVFTPAIDQLLGLLLAALCIIAPAVIVFAAGIDRRRAGAQRPVRRWLQLAAPFAAVSMVLALLDGFLIEPNLLTVTRVTFANPQVPAGHVLRIVHLSDLHVSKPRALYARVLSRVRAERPDLILLTGDLVQFPGVPQEAHVRQMLAELAAIAPVTMVLGNHDRAISALPPRCRLLRNATQNYDVPGMPIRVIGWEQEWEYHSGWQPPQLGMDPHRINIILTHSPDWFDQASAQGADLALAGHTHGGQVRLPFWGAVLLSAEQGKRFEYGAYRMGKMNAFVTRGIGGNPWPMPPVRFLCPPEIAVITLQHGELLIER